MRRLILALLAVISLGASCQRGPGTASTPAGNAGVKVVAHTEQADISSKEASDGTYAVLITPRGASEPVTLPVAARSGDFKEAAGEATAGDPLAPISQKAVVSGEEERKVATWVRPMRAGAGKSCVLAEQQFGFEHLKRNHTVVCADGAKARVVWSKEEGAGPTWTTVDLKDLDNDGVDEVIYYAGFAAPDGAEKLDVTVLKWSGAELKESAGEVQMLTAGAYRTAELARAARKQSGSDACRNLLWVLEMGKGEFALATKTTADTKSLAAWKDLRTCYPGLKSVQVKSDQ